MSRIKAGEKNVSWVFVDEKEFTEIMVGLQYNIFSFMNNYFCFNI